MSDGGRENDNLPVLNFLNSKSMQRMIARVGLHYSNSMVESLFRMLKSNFLRSEKLRNQKDVERKVDFLFSEHNNVVPKIQFGGSTPKEIFLNEWHKADMEKLKAGIRAAAGDRRSRFNKMACIRCAN